MLPQAGMARWTTLLHRVSLAFVRTNPDATLTCDNGHQPTT
jgi:hypothetical protein